MVILLFDGWLPGWSARRRQNSTPVPTIASAGAQAALKKQKPG
jgi:hypothetical protein